MIMRVSCTVLAVALVIFVQLGVIVSYVLGPLVILKSQGAAAAGSGTCSPSVDCEAHLPNWSYYLMGQALLAFVVLLITVIGEYVV